MLITPDDLAAHLQTEVSAATATLAITTATGKVQAAAGQRLLAVTADTVTLDGGYDQYLVLPERPVTAVWSVTIDGLTVTDYTPYTRRARLWRYTGWRGLTITTASAVAPYSAVQVSYDHGYTLDDPKLGLARGFVLRLAAAIVANPAAVEALAIDDYRESWGSTVADLPEADVALLRRAYGTAIGSARLVAR
jgi:hypothetical protein